MLVLQDGAIVCLYSCPARNIDEQEEVTISGLWTIETPTIESIRGGGWLVFCRDESGKVEQPLYFVEDETMWAQTDPKSYGKYLAMERRRKFDRERGMEILKGIKF